MGREVQANIRGHSDNDGTFYSGHLQRLRLILCTNQLGCITDHNAVRACEVHSVRFVVGMTVALSPLQ